MKLFGKRDSGKLYFDPTTVVGFLKCLGLTVMEPGQRFLLTLVRCMAFSRSHDYVLAGRTKDR